MILLAHQPLLASLPFVVAVLVLTAGIAVLAFRERPAGPRSRRSDPLA